MGTGNISEYGILNRHVEVVSLFCCIRCHLSNDLELLSIEALFFSNVISDTRVNIRKP